MIRMGSSGTDETLMCGEYVGKMGTFVQKVLVKMGTFVQKVLYIGIQL